MEAADLSQKELQDSAPTEEVKKVIQLKVTSTNPSTIVATSISPHSVGSGQPDAIFTKGWGTSQKLAA